MTTTRRLGLAGAIGIGVGSMLGAGVFLLWPVAARVGPWAVPAIVLAGAIAAANAMSTAQLAARYPVAGGAYAYGRAELSPWWGRVAGWSFVVGKTASIMVGGLVVGNYLWPERAGVVAAVVIVASWALNARGITRTAAAATAVAVVVVVGLGIAATVSWVNPAPGSAAAGATPAALGLAGGDLAAGVVATAAAAFFAFAGYARIATLSEEVRDPARVIPRAIASALGLVLVLYVALAVTFAQTTALGALFEKGSGAARDVPRADPVVALVEGSGAPAWPLHALAAVAAFGAVLALTAGSGRTLMAMAREGDAPRGLARTGTREVPWLAELTIALVAVVAVLALGGTSFLAVSVVTVLVYYAVANAAAIAQARAGRRESLRVPQWVSAAGTAGSAGLAAVVVAQDPGGVVPVFLLYAALGVGAFAAGVRGRRSE